MIKLFASTPPKSTTVRSPEVFSLTLVAMVTLICLATPSYSQKSTVLTMANLSYGVLRV